MGSGAINARSAGSSGNAPEEAGDRTMAFDETLAAQIRQALARRKGIEDMKMFGGVVVATSLSGRLAGHLQSKGATISGGGNEAEPSGRLRNSTCTACS